MTTSPSPSPSTTSAIRTPYIATKTRYLYGPREVVTLADFEGPVMLTAEEASARAAELADEAAEAAYSQSRGAIVLHDGEYSSRGLHLRPVLTRAVPPKGGVRLRWNHETLILGAPVEPRD